jgi:hypothetical protein
MKESSALKQIFPTFPLQNVNQEYDLDVSQVFYTIFIAPMFTKNLFQCMCILYTLNLCYKIFKNFKMFWPAI